MTDPDGSRTVKTSTLQVYGEPYPAGPSSMATTVGLTAAVTARCILDGTINRKGVFLPVTPDVYAPVLGEVEGLGIQFVEREFAAD